MKRITKPQVLMLHEQLIDATGGSQGYEMQACSVPALLLRPSAHQKAPCAVFRTHGAFMMGKIRSPSG